MTTFGNPVRGTIYASQAGTRWYLSQGFGCTGFAWEPHGFGCQHFHRGIDIAASDGSCGGDVLAAAAGTVEWSGPLNDGNQAIIIRHASGLATGYSHLQSRKVGAGQKVTRGQEIGKVGRTGLATGCHLHFAVKSGFPASGDVNDFYLDAYSAPAGGKGKWADPWKLLEQNQPKPKTVHPKPLDGSRIRKAASTSAAIFAETDLPTNTIRTPDGLSLGPITQPRPYGGTVEGGPWQLPDGTTGDNWVRIKFGTTYRFLASGLAVVA